VEIPVSINELLGEEPTTDWESIFKKENIRFIESDSITTVRKLGSGSFGIVMLGEWLHDGKKTMVAIKSVQITKAMLGPDTVGSANQKVHLFKRQRH